MSENLKESNDGTCPHCGARDARIIGRHGAGASRDGGLPPYEWYDCLCLNPYCRKEFRVLASTWNASH
jgi:hypothetical protein